MLTVRLSNFPKICTRTYSSSVDGLLVSKKRDKGIIQFNRPEKLNAHSLEIQVAIAKTLRDFENDSSVSAVIIKGNEAGFSAGGDIVQFIKLLESDAGRKYFMRNGVIFHRGLLRLSEFKKPVISLADGICMGGGGSAAFLSSHPVTTERTVFAMPEMFIGLYPNVGANYFLANLPNNVGMWAGLTGRRFIGSEIVKIGLSKHFVNSKDISKLEDAIVSLDSVNNENVSKTIANFHAKPDFSKWNIDLTQVERLFAGDSVEEIVEHLKNDSSDFSVKILNLFSTFSPTSLKIAFNLFRQSQLMKYDKNQALSADFSFFNNFYAQSEDDNLNDFREGIRSVLIDKKHKPNWIPKTLDQVDDKKIISYFTTNVVDLRLSDSKL